MPQILDKQELEKFKYWREFLIRSENYKELCRLINKKKASAPFEKLIYSWCPTYHELKKPYDEWLWRNVTEAELQVEFNANKTYGDILKGIYPLFQDIFDEPFDNVEHRVKLFYELTDWPPISCAKERLDMLVFDFTQKAEQAQLNSTETISREFSAYLEGMHGEPLVGIDDIIFIDTRWPKELIKKEFNNYLNRVYDRKALLEQTPSIQPFFSTGYKNFSHFDSYLQAYDAKNRVSEAEAYKRLFPNASELEQESNIRTLRNRLARATYYIEAAENGTFPSYNKIHPPKDRRPKGHLTEYSKVSEFIANKRHKERQIPYDLKDYFSD